MQGWLIFLLTLILASFQDARSVVNTPTASLPANCLITLAPNTPFIAPAPNSPFAPRAGDSWIGSASLWTVLPDSGIWSGLPLNPEGYSQKVMWWRQGYSWTDEPKPALTVTGRRLDESAPPLNVSNATNAFAEDIQSAMLVGVDFPTLGCWEITGHYADSELSFVVWVAP
ncbi:MAG: hypothetical protein ABI700_20255 [Chloroflexota bacterium]